MQRYLYLFFLLFFVSPLFSQNDWKQGYVIICPGDTARGLIDDRGNRSNSVQCCFKADKDAREHVYIPMDIYGYRFLNGKYFIAKKASCIDESQPVFLEFLIHGRVNIYHYKDKIMCDRYFVEKDTGFYELKNSQAIRNIDGITYRNDKQEYIGLLTYLLRDAEMQDKIQNSQLDTKSLITLARSYHEKVCHDENCVIYEKQVTRPHLNVDVYAGASLSKVGFAGVLVSDFAPGYLFGVRLDLVNAMVWAKNLSFSIGLALQNRSAITLRAISSIKQGTDISDENYVTYQGIEYCISNLPPYSYGIKMVNSLDVNLKTVLLKIPISIHYTFSRGIVRPGIGVGLIQMFVLTQNKEFINEVFYARFGRSIPLYHIGITGDFNLDIMLKNGHPLFLNVAYDYTTTMEVNELYRFTDQMFSLTIGYRF